MKRSVLLAGLAAFAVAMPSHGGEGLFSRVYTVETVPQGHFEVEQLVRDREGRAFGSYNSIDLKTELEYGITDKFQLALYLNTGHISAHNSPDDDDPQGATGFTRNASYLQSIAAEFIYRIYNPVSDGIGLAFYLEPEYDFTDLHNGLPYDTTFENEARMLVQKNFLDDRLIIAYNLILEGEFIRFKGDDQWAGELDFNNEIGVSYRFASNWYGGLEARNHNELGDFHNHEHSVYWAGPALHYGGQKAWATLGVLRQVYGRPSGTADNGSYIGDDLFLRSHEKWETTFKIGIPF
ncbi:MAG TPA: DUF6662 family protein [Thermoanaerobaculia bacterium]|jgi:hypothetical protein|nr:DUF6662 family protein [Thermoanaerobaculia bacterium]